MASINYLAPLIEHLTRKGYLKTRSVISAMKSIDILAILDEHQARSFLNDRAVEFKNCTRVISAPHMTAIIFELLDLEKDDKLLILGSKLGYFEAIASRIITEGAVKIIDAKESVLHLTMVNLKTLGIKRTIRLKVCDPLEGEPRNRPWTKILITAGVSEIPNNLLAQLAIGGSIFAPVERRRGNQVFLQVFRDGRDSFKQKIWGDVSFSPLDREPDTEAKEENIEDTEAEAEDYEKCDDAEAEDMDEDVQIEEEPEVPAKATPKFENAVQRKDQETLDIRCPHCTVLLIKGYPIPCIAIRYPFTCKKCTKEFTLWVKIVDGSPQVTFAKE
nr:hypothetical protein [Candidatus Sigynarchaeum springense]